MGEKKQKKFLTVAPFECAWRKELRFKEAGRGCVAFEASAHNDVTVVFREQVGSQHYHYKMDNSPNYTVVLGSHRNRRLKIEVNGKTVVDAAGVGLCCSSEFQSYWISIYDGLICIGTGRYPFQNPVFEWLDSKPNRNVQYVGLSSWDKHVGYRNVNVLPLTPHHNCLWKHFDHIEYEGVEEDWEDVNGGCEISGLGNFLESWDVSDMFFLVGVEEKTVPAHMVILGTAGNFHFSPSGENVIRLPLVTYPVLHAFLQYIYTGQTQIVESQLGSLRDLSLQFQVLPLVRQCEEIIDRFKTNKKLFDSGKKVELAYSTSRAHRCTVFPCELPIDAQKLKQLLLTGKHSDVNIYIHGHGLVARAHKLILSLWSSPFMKMFTNGMSESNSSEVYLRDVSVDAFSAMLQFMYNGELEMKDRDDMGDLLLQLLLLADQFGVTYLQQECCNSLLECLSEDSICPVLQIVSSIPSCKLLAEMCERNFSRHFNYCTTASTDFVWLDEATFMNILQHPDLTVTSEERVLDAILLWCMQAGEILGWEAVEKLLKSSTPELLFGERLGSMETLLPFVRFPLMLSASLKKLEKSSLSSQIPLFQQLVTEAIKYSESEMTRPVDNQNVRFQHRQSSFKELQYIRDGDNNGVIYFAGTSYGEHQWVNPILAKKITVTASSPASRYTDPKALVSRTYQATSFAGPRIENGRNCAWWMVDIGQDHQLMCNHYTWRQDGSASYMRWWAIQGSLNGENWVNLRVHDNDQTTCKPGQFASWPIHGPTALLPFRFFRVILTGPTTSDSNPWNLCICFLELYGYFH
ncbi:BTB/POZ domain-containing protein At2g30600 [Magnolia sinica]|uniref:BTB/POZ domain-containing protein At2g30600 n=1 Tax=Magnolia sinica TaxID=86752 RepID=UPI002658AD59|nr:BTB/POZ domain-containing protein At2g30600 [Magnolia sinica]XP_058090667.1 BTB/POZ domain-containing protein At2g30600 [Magnolia sinica]